MRPKVLIVDDDPSHLEIYGLLLKQAGFEPVTALVRFTGVDFPTDTEVDGIVLDSRLNSLRTCADLAGQLRNRYAGAPIVLLSDVDSVPGEMAPGVAGSVTRGDPAALLEKLSALVPRASNQFPENCAEHVVDCAPVL